MIANSYNKTDQGIELVWEGEELFAKPISRSVLRDSRLTWGARGLFVFLWDLPKDWKLRLSHLAKMGPDGRDAVRARLKELEEVGAVRVEVIRGEQGRLAGKRWILVAASRWAIESPLKTESPLPETDPTEERVFRSSVSPRIGKPDAKVLQSHGSPNSSVAAPLSGGTAFAAADPQKWKSPRRWESGLETWYQKEDQEAIKLEAEVPGDLLLEAVKLVRARPNKAGNPTSPVPSLVEVEVKRIARRREEELESGQRRRFSGGSSAEATAAGLAAMRKNVGGASRI